ncbi:MAG: peptidoglycan-binding domain-containing protein [Candidatus Zixiibacteriota bacterium]
MSELEFRGECGRNCSDKKQVRLIQEWLCLWGFTVTIDGSFGPATEQAVSLFQRKRGLTPTGTVDLASFQQLIEPMTVVLTPLKPNGRTRSEMVVAHASRHLQSLPREVGRENCGPWVRLYLDGHEGREWPWCAGFVSFVVRQACESMGEAVPFPVTYSCDTLAQEAQSAGRFIGESERSAGSKAIEPGYLFLVRARKNDWVHTGIVLSVGKDYFESIEGNTNEQGYREGYAVCRRVRNYARKDFIAL